MVDRNECLFCRMVRGEIPVKKVHEDEGTLAFLDINPRNPGHTLVIPKSHYETVFDMPEEEAGEYFKSVKRVAAMVKAGMNAQGVSLSSSNGQAAGQVVSHVHFHVIPRFLSEGPVGLEGILPTKRLDEKTMDQVVKAIVNAPESAGEPKGAIPGMETTELEEEKPPQKRPAQKRPSMNDMPRPTSFETEQSKTKKRLTEKDLDDEEIEFDF